MGLASAPVAFHDLMEFIFTGLTYEIALVYPDDVIIFGKTSDEHLKRLELFFQRLAENGLKINGSNAIFSKTASASWGTSYPRVELRWTQKK